MGAEAGNAVDDEDFSLVFEKFADRLDIVADTGRGFVESYGNAADFGVFFQSFGDLFDDEIQYIKYLSIMKDDESPRCDSVDYNIDDSYCANCEDADACFIREVKRLMKN